MTDFSYHDHLPLIASEDSTSVGLKDKQYDGSWKKRGGVGAFMMLARKWDRLENYAKKYNYDILEAIDKDGAGSLAAEDGTVIAEIRDLRRYLLLLEAHVRQMVEGSPQQAVF